MSIAPEKYGRGFLLFLALPIDHVTSKRRMFEIFLDATIRGKDLGQFFTPGDICKLMVNLSNININVTRKHLDKVLDACCGSGGFLIIAMQMILFARPMCGRSRRGRAAPGERKPKASEPDLILVLPGDATGGPKIALRRALPCGFYPAGKGLLSGKLLPEKL